MSKESFFDIALRRIKAHVPGILTNYPYASAAIFFAGIVTCWLISLI